MDEATSPTRVGFVASSTTIASLFRDRFDGRDDFTLPGEHDSIVDRETFDEVQRQIASRQTRSFETGERKAKPERETPLLQGVLICGHCDRPMGMSISQNGSIRYPYYRCRSTAGGRPPCVAVSVHCHEIETLISTNLGQPNASDPDEMAGIAEAWNRLDETTQRMLLPTMLRRVVWHHADQEITIELFDDTGRNLNAECQLDGDQEPG